MQFPFIPISDPLSHLWKHDPDNPIQGGDNLYAPTQCFNLLYCGGWRVPNVQNSLGQSYDSIYSCGDGPPVIVLQGTLARGIVNDPTVSRLSDGSYVMAYSWVGPWWPGNNKSEEDSSTIGISTSPDGIHWTEPKQVQFDVQVDHAARPSRQYFPEVDEWRTYLDGSINGVEGTYAFNSRGDIPNVMYFTGRVSPEGVTYYDVSGLRVKGTTYFLYRDPGDSPWAIRLTSLAPGLQFPFPPGKKIIEAMPGSWCQSGVHNADWLTDYEGSNIVGIAFGGFNAGTMMVRNFRRHARFYVHPKSGMSGAKIGFAI